jgi:limonene-1,2-epoxide hydrolase
MQATMTPKELIQIWIDAFNRADAEALAALYAKDAINHQVANAYIEGRDAIKKMFETEFSQANMVCIPENIFEDGDWAILEWKDPLGLRGCGFFHIVDQKIKLQRGYWDKISFYKLHNIPLEL